MNQAVCKDTYHMFNRICVHTHSAIVAWISVISCYLQYAWGSWHCSTDLCGWQYTDMSMLSVQLNSVYLRPLKLLRANMGGLSLMSRTLTVTVVTSESGQPTCVRKFGSFGSIKNGFRYTINYNWPTTAVLCVARSCVIDCQLNNQVLGCLIV